MRCATIDELARDPVGRWVGGATFAHFCLRSSLWGLLLWGRPNEQDAIQLGRSLVLELEPGVPRHDSIVDASRLEGGDASAFIALQKYMTRHSEALAKQVSRLALVRPSGLEGAIVAGAYEVIERPYPVKLFGDVAGALAWLAPDGHLAELAASIAAVHTEATGTPPILGALRSWLDGHLADPTVAAAASALGVSERTLQRKLGDMGTTFLDEASGARVRAAQRLLRDGDTPLTAIALEVGCASLQHFSALFRRRTGESPSAWRVKNRALPKR